MNLSSEYIKKSNQAIDKFMGQHWDINHPDWEKYSCMFRNTILHKISNPTNYHLGWEFLMPVVCKISNKIGTFEIKKENNSIIEIWQNCVDIINKNDDFTFNKK